MVASELALALTLATGAALLALSLMRLLTVDPGFDPARSATARVSAYDARYPEKRDVVQFFDEVLARIREVPDVAAAGAGSSLPLSGQQTGTAVVAQGRPVLPGQRPTAGWQFVTPGYLAAAGLRLRDGRDFTSVDRTRDSHVTIINEELARSLFPGENPIGRRVGVGGGDASGDWHEIVGVVADVRHRALDAPAEPRVYDLFGQHWGRTLYVVARSHSTDAAAVIPVMRYTVTSLDAEAPLFEASTLQALVDRSAGARRLATRVASALGAAGVLLALIGVYAVASAAVAERTREIGVRAALGASPSDLFSLIAAEGARTALLGGALGLAGSVGVVRLLDAQLYGVRPSDAWWLIPAIVAAVCTASLAAAIPPARRAATADPLTALRVEGS